jgi:hypothetical protein
VSPGRDRRLAGSGWSADDEHAGELGPDGEESVGRQSYAGVTLGPPETFVSVTFPSSFQSPRS